MRLPPAATLLAASTRQAHRRLGDRLEEGQGKGSATRATEAVAARVHPGEGQLDVDEGSPSTSCQHRIHFSARTRRLPIFGLGRIGTVLGLLLDERCELLAPESKLLLQRDPQGGKPIGECIVWRDLHRRWFQRVSRDGTRTDHGQLRWESRTRRLAPLGGPRARHTGTATVPPDPDPAHGPTQSTIEK